MENSSFPFGAISNMCASGNIVGFSPCDLGHSESGFALPSCPKNRENKTANIAIGAQLLYFGSVLDPTSSEGKYRDRPFSVFFLHVLKDVSRVEGVAIFQLYMTVNDSIQFAKVARKLCLRKR